MGYTIPVGDYLHRPEIPGRLLRYFADTQRRHKEYLRRLDRIYSRCYAADPNDPYLVGLKNSIAIERGQVEQLRDVIYQIHILREVARPGPRPRKERIIEGRLEPEVRLLQASVAQSGRATPS